MLRLRTERGVGLRFLRGQGGRGLGGGGTVQSRGVHYALGFDVVARGAAFDHVAGEGEGRADEADDAELVACGIGLGAFWWAWGAEMLCDFGDGFGDVAEFARAVGAEVLDLLEGADGGVDD